MAGIQCATTCCSNQIESDNGMWADTPFEMPGADTSKVSGPASMDLQKDQGERKAVQAQKGGGADQGCENKDGDHKSGHKGSDHKNNDHKSGSKGSDHKNNDHKSGNKGSDHRSNDHKSGNKGGDHKSNNQKGNNNNNNNSNEFKKSSKSSRESYKDSGAASVSTHGQESSGAGCCCEKTSAISSSAASDGVAEKSGIAGGGGYGMGSDESNGGSLTSGSGHGSSKSGHGGGHGRSHDGVVSMSGHASGSMNFEGMYDQLAEMSGFDMRKELNALMQEASSDKFSSPAEGTAAFAEGMRRISEHLYDTVLPKMMMGTPEQVKFAVDLLNASFHKPNMKGHGHDVQSSGSASFELMHVLNPHKDNLGVLKGYFKDDVISPEEAVDIQGKIKSGQTFSDLLGAGGSADGRFGQGFKAKNLAAFAGYSGNLSKINGVPVSVSYKGFDGANQHEYNLSNSRKGGKLDLEAVYTEKAKFDPSKLQHLS